jgi:hypothetical protein
MIQQELLADPKPLHNDTRRLIVGYACSYKDTRAPADCGSKILAFRAKDSRLTSLKTRRAR